MSIDDAREAILTPGARSDARGTYADGQSAALHDVLLSIEGDRLCGRRISDGAEVIRWPLADVRSESLDNARETLTTQTAPDAALTVSAEFVAIHLGNPGALSSTKARWKSLLIFGGGTILAAALIYMNLDPVARAIAHRVPRSYEAELGRGLQGFLAREYCETPTEQKVLSALANRLGGGASEVHILDSGVVNAFTFPGGIVIVTRGLIGEAKGPDEVAGVVAHELEHVARRHVMTHVIRTSLLTGLWQLSVGDFTGLFVVDPKTALDIASLHFSRADESEADRGAVVRLDSALISRKGFRDFFARMQAKTDAVPGWLSNHPTSADRLQAIGYEVGAVARTPAMSVYDWDVLKEACPAKPTTSVPASRDAGAGGAGRDATDRH